MEMHEIHLYCLKGSESELDSEMPKIRSSPVLREKDSLGRTLLHLACLNYNNPQLLVEFLVGQLGFDVNAQDDGGNTPLHYTVECSKIYYKEERLIYLIKKGANVNIRNEQGNDPIAHSFYYMASLARGLLYDSEDEIFQRVKQTLNEEQIEFLRTGLKEENFDRAGYEVTELRKLYMMVKSGGLKVEGRRGLGNTLLHLAAYTGLPLVALYLPRGSGQSRNSLNDEGKSPLQLAEFAALSFKRERVRAALCSDDK